jgi:hypothetical protein
MFGDSSSTLTVIHSGQPQVSNQLMANIMDHKPLINIMPFGLCKSLTNPVVAAATASNFGVLRPMPCIPNTTTPWIPGEPKALIKREPALLDNCKLLCTWLGEIQVINPGQTKFTI